MEFSYVIRCLIKKKEVDLALVERLDPSTDRLRDIEDVSQWPLSLTTMCVSALNVEERCLSTLLLQSYGLHEPLSLSANFSLEFNVSHKRTHSSECHV